MPHLDQLKAAYWKIYQELGDLFFYVASATEINKHAVTHCFGDNFSPSLFIHVKFTLTAFLSYYGETTNIPICTTSTALTLSTIKVIILEFEQGLWFDNQMRCSFININQCIYYGFNICDDSTEN